MMCEDIRITPAENILIIQISYENLLHCYRRKIQLSALSVFKDICTKFQIESLSDNQKTAIIAVKEGKDVFVGTKTGSGKSLTYESFPVVKPDCTVLVIAPLVTIVSEQCNKLTKLGFEATYVGKDSSENDSIGSGRYDFVFGSPEVLVGDIKWRKILKSDVYQEKLGLIVVDEAHTAIHWGEGDGTDDPFRVCFSRIGEIRSLCPKASMAALTATSGPSQRRKIMTSLCFRSNAQLILDSPDRENIKISTITIPNKDNLDKVFCWLIDSLRIQKEHTERHIIFCESINDVSKMYSTFVKQLGKNNYFEMFHSKTNENIKEKNRHDMTIDGEVRGLICTNAAGMGVNFFGVHNIVHYKLPRQIDTFVQQMGRSGRDGKLSDELIMYKNNKNQLRRVENGLIKLTKDNTKCRHEILCGAYVIKHTQILPAHNCCDVCAKSCNCVYELCPRTHEALKVDNADDNESPEEEMQRFVSENDRKHINQRLMSYKFALTSAASGVIIDSDVLHGLTDEIVTKIVDNCNTLFTPTDIMSKYPIWSFDTAVEICNIISDVFGDTDMYNLLEDTEEDSD